MDSLDNPFDKLNGAASNDISSDNKDLLCFSYASFDTTEANIKDKKDICNNLTIIVGKKLKIFMSQNTEITKMQGVEAARACVLLLVLHQLLAHVMVVLRSPLLLHCVLLY